MPRAIQEAGNHYNQLVVLKASPKRYEDGALQWVCRCICGNKTTVRGGDLRSGHIKSCGCASALRLFIHGESYPQTIEYRTWQNMLRRCDYKRGQHYPDYGGRGITVCARWNPRKGGSYKNFLEDVGRRPRKGMSIERKDNNKGYSPDNVIWATASAQRCNQRARRYKHDK